jgi:NAD(P)-dependent dehydrogenase (short-subunit alcohol dehydrogenase family)
VDIDLDAARKTAEVNIVGTLGWIQDVIRDQRLGFRGVIVNVSSISSSTVLPGIAFYGATKSAVEGLTRSLAVELAPHVRINAVAPAVVETEFSRVLHEKRNAAEEGYLLHRFGHTEDVASAVAFLASAESSWITGQTLILDGGLSVGGVRR